MGAIQSSLKSRFNDLFSALKGRKKASLSILGLDSAGKTTLVNMLRGSTDEPIPTIGFNIEEVVFNNTSIKVWDVGGQNYFRKFWVDYAKDSDGLVFMIDISNSQRFEDSYRAFEGIVPGLAEGIPIVLFLNKVDQLKGKVEEIDENVKKIEEIYQFEESRNRDSPTIRAVGKSFKAKICTVSVRDDTNVIKNGPNAKIQHSSIYPGFKWLIDSINNESTA